MTLFLNVLFDDLICDVAATHTEVAARPQVSAPKLLPQMWKFVHHFVGRLPFQLLDEAADRHTWRHAQEQMDMIFRHVPFHDCDLRSAADFADQLTESETYFTCHDRLTILRHPHNVQMDAKDRMCAVPIVRHADEFSTRWKTC